jgi:hypothetical protein
VLLFSVAPAGRPCLPVHTEGHNTQDNKKFDPSQTVGKALSAPAQFFTELDKCHLVFGPCHIMETVKLGKRAIQLRRLQQCRQWGKTAKDDAQFVAACLLSKRELCRHGHVRYDCKDQACMQSGATGICEHSRRRYECKYVGNHSLLAARVV